MRKLKFHEHRLLRRVDFLDYNGKGHREGRVMQRYRVVERDDYKKYNGICLMVQKQVHMIKQMDPRDPFRIEMTDMLLDKLYNMGVIPTKKSLVKCENLSVSSFCRSLSLRRAILLCHFLARHIKFHSYCSLVNHCRRRLATVMTRIKMAEHLKEAVTYIQQGHVRVGPEVVTDPAFLVTRNMEDFITWADSSKIKKKIMKYNDALDDYDVMA
ncbi:unnamed protein product [Urochloa decumbens]|uniref:U3 small nucleolar ribonucleoprotein protein IMP3 n=1 Tax=Urochloa decumbens TaxID=240449 RepID=A0ABC9F9G8_9POAL